MEQLRKVRVYNLNKHGERSVGYLKGWFHAWGWTSVVVGEIEERKAVALVENEQGYIMKIDPEQLRFVFTPDQEELTEHDKEVIEHSKEVGDGMTEQDRKEE